MAEEIKESKAAQAFARYRTSRLFFIILTAFCSVWVTADLVCRYFFPGWQFDEPGFPTLTLILSIEASLATSLLMLNQEKGDYLQKKQLEYIANMQEAMLALLEHDPSS